MPARASASPPEGRLSILPASCAASRSLMAATRALTSSEETPNDSSWLCTSARSRNVAMRSRLPAADTLSVLTRPACAGSETISRQATKRRNSTIMGTPFFLDDNSQMDGRVNEVLAYWFGQDDQYGKAHKRWFVKDVAFDAQVTKSYLALYEEIVRYRT